MDEVLKEYSIIHFTNEDVGKIYLIRPKSAFYLVPHMLVLDKDLEHSFKNCFTGEVFSIGKLLGEMDSSVYKVQRNLDDIKRNTQYSVREDMGQGFMSLLVEDDGDVCISLSNGNTEDFQKVDLQFCTYFGGGKSPQVRQALLDLVVAIERDSK